MNGRVFAALFISIFIAGALPMLLVQPLGSSSASLTVGFVLPLGNPYHLLMLMMVGMISGWLGRETMALLPVSALLILAIGAMSQIDPHQFPQVHIFIACAIILFSLSVSMLRCKPLLMSIPPIAFWAYFTGSDYMQGNMLSVSTPLYFLVGILISSGLIIAIGLSLQVALTGSVHYSVEKLRAMPRVSAFLSFF